MSDSGGVFAGDAIRGYGIACAGGPKGVIEDLYKEILYRDQPGPGGLFRPVAFEAECRLFSEQGKARHEYRGTCMDVDPESLARTPSASVYPVFLSREQ